MSDVSFNTAPPRAVPVNRNRLFYSREDAMFDMMMAQEYLEGDISQTVVLYRVSYDKTNTDALYGEAEKGNIVYETPVEVPCMFEIQPAELKAYDKEKQLGTYQKPGKLVFGVMMYTFVELGIDIKVGDYVGVQVDEHHMEYWCVENDGRNNYDNQHMLFGTVPYYRSITCRYADEFKA